MDARRVISEARQSGTTRRSRGVYLVEVSWEVCSQAGGIYTVLRSKAPETVEKWGASYLLVGPYNEASAKIEFEAQRPPRILRPVIDSLAARGTTIHYGRWLITGRPQVMLLDLGPAVADVNKLKYFLWKDCGLGTPGDDRETDLSVAFGYATADLICALAEHWREPLIAQFHEWQAGVALPVLKQRQARVATVFTTHATLVGRALSAAQKELYERLTEFEGDAVAKEHGFPHRFAIEKAAAKAADVFTTVSGITAMEAEQFLGRPADCVLPNGLNVERFAAPHEFQNLHIRAKQQIHNFVMGHFFPSYTFDLSQTLYLFTAGRYEYRNKGIDVFIDALYELNRRLKAEPTDVTVVAFIVTRAPYRGINVETLNRQAMFNELQEACGLIKEDMGRRLFHCVSEGRLPSTEDLLYEYDRVRLKRMIHAWRQGPPPTIVTHDLLDDANDPVLKHLRARRLFNAPDDPVKVIFHPEFITMTSPLFGLEYDHFVRGCNLGVFPSYYEPWGYTPLECIVRGVPAITSDLSGFGAYLMEHFPDHDSNGMYVARRRRVSTETTVYQVAGWLHDLTRMSLRDRIALRNRVEEHGVHFDWSELGKYYRGAHVRALQHRFPERELPPLNGEGEYPPPPHTVRGRRSALHAPASRGVSGGP